MLSLLLHGLIKFITWLFFIGIAGSTFVLILVSIGDFKAVMGWDEDDHKRAARSKPSTQLQEPSLSL